LEPKQLTGADKKRKEMSMVTSALKMFWQEEDGQDLVEYSLLLAFIALAAITILNNAGGSIRSLFGGMSSALLSASTAASTGGS
jgi:Flp pilus assembly pilin Flp